MTTTQPADITFPRYDDGQPSEMITVTAAEAALIRKAWDFAITFDGGDAFIDGRLTRPEEDEMLLDLGIRGLLRFGTTHPHPTSLAERGLGLG